jgi:hypothetical protein
MTFGILRLLDTHAGQVIFSLILGLGLAALFQRVCKDGHCIIIQGPPLDEVENKIFKQEDKCYRYRAESTACDKDTKPADTGSDQAYATSTTTKLTDSGALKSRLKLK